jgi:hypothetical protein
MTADEEDPAPHLTTLLRAHGEWVVRLREALYGEEGLTSRMAANEEACPLGQWLKERESRFGEFREYQAAREVHRQFHRRASYCLQLLHAGRRSEAIAETHDGGELRRLSTLVVKALAQFSQVLRSDRIGTRKR